MRRTVSALAALASTLVLGAGPFAALGGDVAVAAPGSPAQEGTASEGRLELLSQPVAVAPDGGFTVLVAVDDAPDATDLAVDIYPKAAPGDLVGLPPTTDPEATFEVIPLDEEPATGRRVIGFTIELYTEGQPNPNPPWSHQIDEPGVYPVGVRLRDGDGDVTQLTTALTRLPAPGQEVAQTEAALLVGVHRAPPSDPAVRAEATVADASLLDELGPMLGALRARPDLPATFSVTPDTVARMAADPGAAEPLARLRTELARDERYLLDAPYVDIDAASLVRAGLAGELELQRNLGSKTLAALLEQPQGGIWQLGDRIDPATTAELQRLGIGGLLLPGDALEGGAGTRSPVSIDGGGDTPIATSTSTQVFAMGTGTPDDPVLSAHLLLARIAAAGTTAEPASVVVEVDPATVAPEALDIVFDALLFGTPFYAPTSVAGVLDAAPRVAGRLTTPADVPLGRYPIDLARSRGALTSYASMVGDRPDLVDPYDETLAVSAADELPLAERERDARSVSAALREPFSSVTMTERETVRLGSRDATFPLVVRSELAYPVQVVIELQSNDRVDLPDDRVEQTLQPGRNEIDVKVRTRTTGDTPVRIYVRTPDDGVTLAQSQYTIRSTAVSGVGIVLTIGAAGFLALWWGRHWRRSKEEVRHARRRRLRRGAADDV